MTATSELLTTFPGTPLTAIPGEPQIWVPLDMEQEQQTNRGSHYYSVIGRLAEATRIETAREELVNLAARLPLAQGGWTATLRPLHETVVGGMRASLWMLMGAVGLVLLIACANVANLSLARSAQRAREMSLRAALGAGRARIHRLVLVESVLVSLAGAGAGLALAYGGRGCASRCPASRRGGDRP